MYYYAYIDDVTGFCYDVVESETLMNDPLYILLSGLSDYAEYMKCYKIRKKYVNGEWYDTTVEEAEQKQSTTFGEHIAIFDRWLNEVLDDKADTTHTHSEYAPVSHSHSEYATQVALDTLGTEVDGKADINHTHTGYAPTSHNHDSAYSTINHDHDENYASLSHTHNNYATATSVSELTTTVAGKADSSHNHDSRYYTEAEIDTKLATKSDTSHTHTGVYDTSGSAANALSSANSYTDTEIDALSEIIATKADMSTLTAHTGNITAHITNTERDNWDAAKTHANSAHAPSNAEENQNAFSNIVVNGTTISADAKTDTLTFVAGSNVTITPDANGDSITISSANTVYTHPTSAGNKHVPAGGSSGQILRWSADGTAVWGSDNNTTYSNATQTTSGLMSNADKTKLDGISEGANNYTLPSAGTSLGGVKTGGDVTISSGVITVNDDSHNHIISNVDGLQSALDGKAANSHSHNDTYYTEAETDVLLSNKANTSHTHTISNITNLQTTLDGKAASSHGTHVTYSTAAPVMDGTATVGIASTVARSDHKHPTDTTRASQSDLDALETVVSGKASTSHTHTIANVTNLQTSLDAKQATITGGASTIASSNLTTNRALVSNASGKVAVSEVTSTELSYLDGVTSNVQTQLDGKSSTSHTHSYAGSSGVGGAATSANKLNTNAGDTNTPVYFSSGIPVACTSLDLNTTGSSASCTGNSATATKLQTARTIGLSTGATGTATSFNGSANISIPVTDVKEAYLSWGGRALSGSVSPVDAASSSIHSANRFAFAKAAGITIEYSTDGGSTYSTYSTTDTVKKNLVSGIGSAYYIGARSTSTTVNDKLRITLNATNMGLYTRLRKLLINITTNYATGSNVIIEKAMKGSESTYTTVGTYLISGWSGWNSIPINAAFGGGSTQTYNIANLRLTFGITGVNSSQTANALTIMDIVGIGDTYWSYPSNMAKNGHLYSYDASQNATFPASVNAPTFAGSGVATVSEVETYLGI